MKHLKTYESNSNKKYWKISRKDFKLSLWKIGMKEPYLKFFLNSIRREIQKQRPNFKYIFISINSDDSWGYDDELVCNYYNTANFEYMGEVIITTEDRKRYRFENTVKKYNL